MKNLRKPKKKKLASDPPLFFSWDASSKITLQIRNDKVAFWANFVGSVHFFFLHVYRA